MALPAPRRRPAWMERLNSPWWALIPALSIVAVLGAIEATPTSADALAYVALFVVPPLAGFAAGALIRRNRAQPRISRLRTVSRADGRGWELPLAAVAILFGLAWAAPHSLAGEAAATALSGLACVTLGWLLVCCVPVKWLRLGVYAMAAIDTIYVASDLLQGPNAVLNAAAPAAGLPQLQSVHLGSAVMGFGDLFIAALVGSLLAAHGADGPIYHPYVDKSARRPQQVAAALVAVLALAFDLLFFAVDELPATVPVAMALALVSRWVLACERSRHGWSVLCSLGRRLRRQQGTIHPRS